MDCDRITAERLDSWRKLLKEGNATPILLIGVGHEHRSGELHVVVPEGVEDDLLIGALLYALNVLQPGLIPQHHGERRVFHANP
jgi:hypothetical protein